MQVSCPECSTQYTIPVGSIGSGGRALRCSKCGHEWLQHPIVDPVKDNADLSDEKIAEEGPLDVEYKNIPAVATSESKTFSIDDVAPHIIGAGGALATIALIMLVVLLLRTPLVYAFPELDRFYIALGKEQMSVEISGEGLVFDRILASWEEDGDNSHVSVEGTIINLTDSSIEVPTISAEFLSPDGVVVEMHTFKVEEEMIEGENLIEFNTSILTTPYNATALSLSFSL